MKNIVTEFVWNFETNSWLLKEITAWGESQYLLYNKKMYFYIVLILYCLTFIFVVAVLI